MVKKSPANDDSMDLEEHGNAMLALQLREENCASASDNLSDDELLALYEGRAGDDERARMLRCIANNQEVYGRWLELVESTVTVDHSFNSMTGQAVQNDRQSVASAAHADTAATHRPRPAFGEALLSWVKPLVLPTGALATAAAVFLLVSSIPPNDEQVLRQLYSDYGSGARLLLQDADPLPVRAAGGWPEDLQSRAYTPARTALAQGLQAGFQSIGMDAASLGVMIDRERFSDQVELPEPDRNALVALGRLVTLTYAQCQNPAKTDFFPRAISVYLPLSRQLGPARFSELAIMDVLQDRQAASGETVSPQDMCVFTSNVVGQFGG